MSEAGPVRSEGPAPPDGRAPADAGSASIWVLAVAGAILAMIWVTLLVGAAISVRHRADSAADLAALAGAVAARDGGDACVSAARIAAANRARLLDCRVSDDASLTVVVVLPMPAVLAGWVDGDVRATSRAGW